MAAKAGILLAALLADLAPILVETGVQVGSTIYLFLLLKSHLRIFTAFCNVVNDKQSKYEVGVE